MQLSFIITLIVLIQISNALLHTYAHTKSCLLSRVKPLKDAQTFTSFDDMLIKIDRPVLVDFFALWVSFVQY